MNSYSVGQYVCDIRTVVAEKNSDAAITTRKDVKDEWLAEPDKRSYG